MISIVRPTLRPLRVEYIPPKPDMMRWLFWAFAALMMAFALISLLEGCAETLSPDDQYRAKILLCVERSTTLLESKACRRNVDFQFHVLDGGVE